MSQPYKDLIKEKCLNNIFEEFNYLFNLEKNISPFNKMTSFDFNTLLPAL